MSISSEEERQILLSGLLQSVKKCQIRFGGKRAELARKGDEIVEGLCSALEGIFCHGIKRSTVGGRHQSSVASAVWTFVKTLLNPQDLERFYLLPKVTSDLGRLRAWLRSILNERSLEKYLRLILSSDVRLEPFYHSYGFFRDQERRSTLPSMAAGLSSILFSLELDLPELNVDASSSDLPVTISESVEEAVVAVEEMDLKKKKRKKKLPAQLVSVTGDEVTTTVLDRHGKEEDSLTFVTSSSNGCSKSNTRNSLEKQLLVSQTENKSGGSSFLKQTKPNDLEYKSVKLKTGDDTFESEDDEIDIYSRGEQTDSNSDRSRTSVISKRDTNKKLTPMKNSSIGALIPMNYVEGQDQDLHSEDSLSIRSFGEESDYATANQTLSEYEGKDGLRVGCAPRWSAGDRASSIHASTISREDLKQALLSVMERKDELQKQCQALKKLAASETQSAKSLKEQVTELKRNLSESMEKCEVRTQNLTRENELLKHQLKKYVGAVQKLRDGPAAYETLNQLSEDSRAHDRDKSPRYVDYHFEASEYEKKLIQVAEFHGELIEFNEYLQRQVQVKDTYIQRMREELIDLRGPLPSEEGTEDSVDTISIASLGGDNSSSVSSSCPTSRALLHIWIPSVFLSGSGNKTHHVYQVYLRIKDEEWNIYRRYSDFYNLHKELKKQESQVETFDFPPKKTVGYKAEKVVEERRKRLQAYLRKIVNLMVQTNPFLSTKPNKESVLIIMPFFSEVSSPQQRQPGIGTNKPSSHIRSLSQGRSIFSRRSEPQHATQLAI